MSTREDQRPLEKLKDLKDKVNWNIEEDRCNFLVQRYLIFYNLIRSSETLLFPDIQLFLRPEEFQRLLWDSVNYNHEEFGYNQSDFFIASAAIDGYRDEPEDDQNVIISPRRTTLIHRTAKSLKIKPGPWIQLFPYLFEIYDRCDVNYSDESGYTHFHAACQFGCVDVVREFLRYGQDPNCIWTETGDSVLHIALSSEAESISDIMEMLLRGGADPNLVNKKGLTPLHIIAKEVFHCKILELFFQINDELNHIVQINARDNLGNTPLHLCLESDRAKKMFEVLLRRGANPNLANDEGLSPLHIICKRIQYRIDDSVVLFFKINDELNQRVQVDARDNLDRTPLQWAVAGCLPHAVESLLNRGAGLSSFVFPTSSQLDVRFKEDGYRNIRYKLGLASGLLAVIENLQKRGYELDRSDALMIMKLFNEYKLFQAMEDLDKRWYDDEEFVNEARKTMIKPDLSLCDLIHLRPQEAAKRLTYMDYYKLLGPENLWWIRFANNSVQQACFRHLYEKISRKFFQIWALEPFWKLIHYRLPLECCEMALGKLMNQDLYHIFLSEGQTDKDGKINIITNAIKRNNERPLRARKAPKV